MRLFELQTDKAEIVNSILRDCRPFLSQISKESFMFRNYLFRGIKNLKKDFVKLPVHQNRQPLGSTFDLHRCLTNAFKRLGFTANRNNSIFCTGSESLAKSYGDAFVIFPIGEFTFTWSPTIEDIFYEFSGWNKEQTLKKPYVQVAVNLKYPEIEQELDEYFADFKIIDKKITSDKTQILYSIIGNDATAMVTKFKRDLIPFDPIVIQMNLFDCFKVFKQVKHMDYQSTDLKAAIKSGHEIMIHCNEYYALDHYFLRDNPEVIEDILYDVNEE